jgi:hemin uptake protein HemP
MSAKDNPQSRQGQPSDPASSQTPEIRQLSVADLLGGAKEAILEHEGQLYRLRITSNRKLILTK